MKALLYRVTKSAYRTIVPQRLNKAVFDGSSPVSRAIYRVKAWLEKGAKHDQLYDDHYFQRQDAAMQATARIAADTVQGLGAHRVIDVGCGSGAILQEISRRNIECVGLEYATAAIKRCHGKGLDVRPFDLESTERPDVGQADFVLSTEVAEHLPAEVSDAYVDLLMQLSTRWILITAATPGQGGTDHVNEQPHAYWVSKFEARGAKYLDDMTENIRNEWLSCGADRARGRNVLLFEVDH